MRKNKQTDILLAYVLPSKVKRKMIINNNVYANLYKRIDHLLKGNIE